MQPGVVRVNCYEWRKHITGSVSVNFNYSETGNGYTLTGSGTITHGPLYTGWTHYELQCIGSPVVSFEEQMPPWILRGNNLCEGRAFIGGHLPATSKILMTLTQEGGPPLTYEWGIFWQINSFQEEGWITVSDTLLPSSPYPDWENDPYSVAYRAETDALPLNSMLVGISPVPPPNGSPLSSAVPIRWLKNGQSGTSADGYLNATVSCSFTIA